MTHTSELTKFVGNFIDELAKGGMTDIVISPGSRSTPLSMMIAEHESIKHWVHMDERSAAFFALGMAKQQQKPVALVCTSGTAAANYYPAIVEAFYSRVPLVILTADRPHELRDVGAPQSIDQIHMYSRYVKWFQEVAMPEDSDTMLRYVRSIGARALHQSLDGNAGPVHLNFPFREPLVPDFSMEDVWGNDRQESYHPVTSGKRMLDTRQIEKIKEEIVGLERGLLVCGPQEDRNLAEAVTSLAKHLQLPLLADPLSQVRAGEHEKDHVIECYDAMLKSEETRERFKPDFIIRFGAMPVSKPYKLLIENHPDIVQYVVEDFEGHREPTNNHTRMIYADGTNFCKQWLQEVGTWMYDKSWLDNWREANSITKKCLIEDKGVGSLSEGHVITELTELLPEKSSIYIGNSMPVRDLDTFFMTTPKHIRVLANRGANGIDGMVSSALGAAAHGESVTLILGDLSFYHDLNGLLMAKQYGIDVRIIVINNEGGGIFSFLPQANHPNHFEPLFGTPLQLDFQKAVEMYNGSFTRVETWEQFRDAVTTSFSANDLHVMEVITNRDENAQWHRDKWKRIEESLRGV
ncbi:2-succinyl-5-enolpyruvyl-6-hydroxy-3-cyclohexene-1-carboxylic-acid synthase [Pontibacillus yanchengensis]|uniref:2-succinyl-5-enolpyruvyl-6-hydroxy-3-cyclohexene-1-carboxylate synthase n=1 Tax=Pontibacillus yanchengensis TaxID=462910 RepID=A0A6I5A0N6_9BACI|nr:2-succinyl-5-enolpyruvyl-6-hydroxy-3-cyclohexene-1-carboxylic-acid synthase [Pontibacillus yanchengensis]MYL33793.1 2-succinyl-5-enolpyruvyl-6-hydroxy-3-cyclohexene-1-carboxylic-acid synthase [Pontibacillus yanchengensis]